MKRKLLKLYTQLAQVLQLQTFPLDIEPVTGAPLEIRRFYFTSNDIFHFNETASSPLPQTHDTEQKKSDSTLLNLPDEKISENYRFPYYIIMSKTNTCFDNAILMFHGLNEKWWGKYLPWAHVISETLNRPVILFPMAFHMDRAPDIWSNPRKMIPVARERKKTYPEVKALSFTNVALSHRIHEAPVRFLTSGFQSFLDVIKLTQKIKDGNHLSLSKDAHIDIFGYSIGASLTLLLLCADPYGLFSDSKAFLFCGGSTLNKSNPLFKTIIDNKAYYKLFDFMDRLVQDSEKRLTDFEQYIYKTVSTHGTGITWFKSLLFDNRMEKMRTKRIREMADRIKGAVLTKDKVFPPNAVKETFLDDNNNILSQINEYDMHISYSHEKPFPPNADNPKQVNNIFNSVMHNAVSHFK